MPRVSKRKRSTDDLEVHVIAEKICRLLFGDPGDDDLNSDLFFTAENVLHSISSFRYFGPGGPVAKSSDFFENVLPNLDGGRFRQKVRMSRDGFQKIIGLIAAHPVFSNKSNVAQASIEKQLIVAFSRFGNHGNAAGVGFISCRFGISEDSVLLFTNRTIVALLSIESQFVKWPDTAEKNVIKSRILKRSGFPDCIGMVDGALMVLEYTPQLGDSNYFSHKSHYGITAMIVCDDTRRIRHANIGFCGSAHDNRVFDNFRLGKFSERFFDDEEYILADSGYTTSTTVVASYKKPAALIPENDIFKKYHSSLRMTVEHCIGMVKGRCQSLRGMRSYIRSVKDHQRIVYWIRACFVLHNISLEDEYDDR
ncbi:hypothetical protein BV898_14972 [Hypsibius exemplaris]|uniref:DDE Tnp4 domain-containing protein n=1 Tax=Hypsibius exemplaris TaxID=2072580 RepID=A0A9X6NC25_HYPEX|nr:hypothetical protein BV898_14972 [Hypsibius exemplaris]